MRDRRFKRWVCFVFVLAVVAAGSCPAAADETEGNNWTHSIDLQVASLLLPGTRQANDGHYTKAALFASAAVFSGAGVFFTQIHYDRAVERYEDEKRLYLSYNDRLSSGPEVAYTDIQDTRQRMQEAYDQADERVKWRNVFIGALIATYSLNLLDILLSDPDTGERSTPEPISMELRDGGIRLVKTFSF